jgi:hypothetical protein
LSDSGEGNHVGRFDEVVRIGLRACESFPLFFENGSRSSFGVLSGRRSDSAEKRDLNSVDDRDTGECRRWFHFGWGLVFDGRV